MLHRHLREQEQHRCFEFVEEVLSRNDAIEHKVMQSPGSPLELDHVRYCVPHSAFPGHVCAFGKVQVGGGQCGSERAPWAPDVSK